MTAFFPAALAAGSISLALLLLPGGAVPAHSSGAAPALRLVVGDVVAAVKAPVRAVTHAQRAKPAAARAKPVAVVPTRAQARSGPAPTRSLPTTHRHARPTRPATHAVERTPVSTQPAPAPVAPLVVHGQGKAKAWGHPEKLARHGPPAIPPGQAKKADALEKHAAHGQGGGR